MVRMEESMIIPEAPTGAFKFGGKDDVAEMTGLCRRSVSNLMKRGLPHIKIGRNVRFDLGLVREWLNRRCGKGSL